MAYEVEDENIRLAVLYFQGKPGPFKCESYDDNTAMLWNSLDLNKQTCKEKWTTKVSQELLHPRYDRSSYRTLVACTVN